MFSLTLWTCFSASCRMSGPKTFRSLVSFQNSEVQHLRPYSMWAWVSNYTNFDLSEQDTLFTVPLISRQAVPYWTRGGTCCPGVSTPKTRSLANSSMTNHITWQNPTVSTNPIHTQTTSSILTMVTSHDRWKTNTLNNNTSQTQRHKDGKICTTLVTAWLSLSMVKGHLPCSPASCCSKSWTSSSWRFSKSSAPDGSDQK
jgi:hypothetical protein